MALDFKDYYKILGVPRGASQGDIKKAFRKLAREHHPDMVKPRDRAAAESKFKEINEAYEILSSPENREKYDTLGESWTGPGPAGAPGGWAGDFARAQRRTTGAGRENFRFDGTGFSDFFEVFFGGRGAGGIGRRAEGRPARGRDVEADIMVQLEEAIKGSVRQISFRRSPGAPEESFKVRIPPGVHEGQRIRLAGQGREGRADGHRGDLFLRVRLAQHPDYRVENDDLICEIPLAPWDAVLGTELLVPTPDGAAKLKVPPGTQPGQRFRIRGRGMATTHGGRGDFYAVAKIAIPTRLTDAQREIWERLASQSRP
jgi:curved DNA-binding protein